MIKKRNDAQKNRGKIIKEVLSNPLASQREIADNVWIWKTTVQEHLKELPNATKDDRIISLTDRDFDMMALIQSEKFRRIEEEKGKLNNSDINRWEETAVKRYTLFRWNVTDKDWGLKNTITQLSDNELINLIWNDN